MRRGQAPALMWWQALDAYGPQGEGAPNPSLGLLGCLLGPQHGFPYREVTFPELVVCQASCVRYVTPSDHLLRLDCCIRK